jgi:hypothetical protein
MAQSKGNVKKPKAYGKDKIRPNSGEILGWKIFYTRLSSHRVKSAVNILPPRLPKDHMLMKFSQIEPEDAGIPMPDQVEAESSSDSESD